MATQTTIVGIYVDMDEDWHTRLAKPIKSRKPKAASRFLSLRRKELRRERAKHIVVSSHKSNTSQQVPSNSRREYVTA